MCQIFVASTYERHKQTKLTTAFILVMFILKESFGQLV